MFGSFRLKKCAVTLLSLLGAAVVLGICLLLLCAGGPDTVTLNGEPFSLQAENDTQIEAFLNACGFQPGDCVSDRMITVPKHWNGVYTAYNELQRQQGLSLVPYKGKTARELVYVGKTSDDYAAVLVCDGRIVAAHRTAMRQDEKFKPLIG